MDIKGVDQETEVKQSSHPIGNINSQKNKDMTALLANKMIRLRLMHGKNPYHSSLPIYLDNLGLSFKKSYRKKPFKAPTTAVFRSPATVVGKKYKITCSAPPTLKVKFDLKDSVKFLNDFVVKAKLERSTSAANGYPPAELVTPPSYNNEFSKRHSIPAEEFRHSGEPSDRERRRSSKDYDHRPSSRNNKSPKHDTKVLNSLEKVTPRDKERDNRDRDKPEKPLSIDRTCAEDGESTGKETVKPSKRGGYQNNYFKPLGMRNNLSSGNGGKEVQTKATTNHSTNREQDDLVAMGTLWKSTPGNKTNGNIGRSFSIGSNNGPSQSLSNGYTGGTLTSQRRFSNKFGQQPRQQKDTEPRYPDPLSGASASFQQRLAELAALESETIRWERTRKLKKRSKQETSS